MEFSFLEVLEILFVFIAILFAVFLLTVNTENKLSNLLIAFFLIVTAQDSGGFMTSQFVYPQYPGLGMLINSTIFFQMPLFYLYILSVTRVGFRLRPRHLWHALPFLVIFLVFIPNFYSVSFDQKWDFLRSMNEASLWEIKFSYISLHFQIFAYFIACFWIVKRYKQLVLENYADTSLITYKWLFQFIVVLTIQGVFATFKNIFMFLDLERAYSYSMVILFLLGLGYICWIVLKALRYPELFKGIDSQLKPVKTLIEESIQSGSIPEREVNLQSPDFETKIEKLKSYMLEQEPYLDASLSVSSLSNQVDLSSQELSLLINHNLKQHFFDFVNGYRIRKTMQLLTDPKKKSFTVSEIMYEVGFNSKSSFNTAFKKYTHQTPTQFRENALEKLTS